MEISGRTVYHEVDVEELEEYVPFFYEESFLTKGFTYHLLNHYHETLITETGDSFKFFFQSLKPQEIGLDCYEKHGSNIPFSIDILSVNRPSPFKCFPSNVNMMKISEHSPWDYPLESCQRTLVVPISKIDLFIGLRSVEHCIKVFHEVPELETLVDDNDLLKAFLSSGDPLLYRQVLMSVLYAPVPKVRSAATTLLRRLEKKPPDPAHPLELLKTMKQHAPGDVGMFLTYFCHRFTVPCSEAVTIPPGMIHCIAGGYAVVVYDAPDLAPCGALSVKKSLEDFIACLNLVPLTASQIKPIVFSEVIREGDAVTFFCKDLNCLVRRVTCGSGRESVTLSSRCSSLLILLLGKAVIEGGDILERGRCYFLRANEQMELQLATDVDFIQIEYGSLTMG